MTSVSYRPIRGDDDGEEEAVLNLWCATLPVDRERFCHEYRADLPRRERTFVAADAAGGIFSAVAYSPRKLRDVDGRPLLVGGVSAVATRPDERGRGHARRLLTLAVESMRREGCAWSLLFTDSNGYYERLGWQTIQTRYREGLLCRARVDSVGDYSVRTYDLVREAGSWETLAEVYAAYNASRPLSLARTLPYWRAYLAPKFAAPTALVLVASQRPDGRSADGYLLAHLLDAALVITEIGLRPGIARLAPALLGGLLDQAITRGIDRGRAYLPVDPEVDSALSQAFSSLRTGYHQAMMALPVSADFDMDRIRSTFAAPGAIFWPSDDF